MGLYETLKTNIDCSSVLHAADIPELVEFESIIEEQGLKAALKWRESRNVLSIGIKSICRGVDHHLAALR
jgi:hypothetical protein